MSEINITLVRLKKTKEPVAVFENDMDITELGKAIDEITDPSECEYVDIDIFVPLQINFFSHCVEDEDCHENARIGFNFMEEILSYMKDDFLSWIPMPRNYDYLSINLETENRFRGETPF
jgi:hypothetical protein